MKETNKHIEQEAPVLFGLKKKHNLTVPEGYFEGLPNQLKKITEETPQKTTTVPLKNYWIYATAVAALFIATLFLFNPTTAINQELIAYNETFNNLTAENFEDFFILEQDEFLSENIDFDDTEDLQLWASELQKPLQEMEITEQDFENYFESEIEEYY